MNKKLLLIEPDIELKKLFTGWLKNQGYGIKSVDNSQQASSSLSQEKYDLLISDIDLPQSTDKLLIYCQSLKKDSRFHELPVVVLTYGKDAKKIARALEAGVDKFIFKPFEIDSFLNQMEVIFKEIELKQHGKKVLDINCIGFLIDLASKISRQDFFLLAPVIFNRLIMYKIKVIIGEPIIIVILKRLNELIEEANGFMKEVKFQNGQLNMDGVDKASKGLSAGRIAFGFRNYVYGFLQLVGILTSDILFEHHRILEQ